MKFSNLEKKSDAVFKRLTGVKKETFNKMIEILKKAYIKKHQNGGRPHSLSVEHMLLMTLEYLREYRTYAHIAASYAIGESNAYQTIKWVEDTLIKCKLFSLPGKKALLKSENEFEIVLIDASESPIERPKKNNENSIREKRRDIH
jgi:hypothetical protein